MAFRAAFVYCDILGSLKPGAAGEGGRREGAGRGSLERLLRVGEGLEEGAWKVGMER